MIIKNGYGSQPLEVKLFCGHYNDGTIELWTEMFDAMKHSEHEVEGDVISDPKFRTEVLHYITLTEAIELRNELNRVIKEAAGV